MTKRTPHWITGMGCLSAAGVGIQETCLTLFNGDLTTSSSVVVADEKRFFQLVRRQEWAQRFNFAGEFLPNLFALVAADEALTSAQLTPGDWRGLRVGVCLGSTVGGTNFQEPFTQAYYQDEYPSPKPLYDAFTNNSAQFLSRHFSCRGPVLMINNACTSGVDAIGIGAQWLDADLCDLVICGGTEVILTKIFYGFRSLMLCSPFACKPFDRDRQGLSLGEGAGLVILEKRTSPRQPIVEFLGYGSGSDAFHPTSPQPAARGLSLAVSSALAQAGLELPQIDFINAHGTATVHNDLAEGRWIRNHAPTARVVATKGYTGHTLGAAGGVEAVFTALSLMQQKLPRSIGFAKPDPEIGVVPTGCVETGSYQSALSFSLGFGGTNAALCLGRMP